MTEDLSAHFAARKAAGDLEKAEQAAKTIPDYDPTQDPNGPLATLSGQADPEGVQSAEAFVPTREREVEDMPRGIKNTPTAPTEAPEGQATPETPAEAPAAPAARAHRLPETTFSSAQVTAIHDGYREQIDGLNQQLTDKDAQLTTAYVMLGKWAILKQRMEDAGVNVD